MLVNLRLLFGLLWRPMTVVRQLRERSPVGFAVIAAWLTTLLYAVIASMMAMYAQDQWNGGDYPSHLEIRGSGIPGRLLIGTLTNSAMMAVMVTLFVAAVYVPFAILIANLFERRASFSLVIREEYAPVVSCTLLSLAASMLVTLPAALLIGWQSAWLRSDAIIGYLVLLFVMPLPIFAALMTITLGTSFRIGWAAAAVTTLISFLS